jgi:hypothetical protein
MVHGTVRSCESLPQCIDRPSQGPGPRLTSRVLTLIIKLHYAQGMGEMVKFVVRVGFNVEGPVILVLILDELNG